ncbi:hypothetical protein Tco_1172727 [Tanacetum coccineum]
MERKRNESCDKCFNLDAELLKSQNAHNDLLKSYSHLEKYCISLELSIQLNQEIFQKHKSCDNQNALEIPEFFENNDLKARLQDKDTTIYKLKDIIKSMREKSKEENVNYDYCELETKNVELENSVAKLLSENERLCNEINHVKQTLLQNREAHINYFKYTQEQADILQEIVEQAKAKQPLDKELDFACNKKNDRISRTPSRNIKNKVEAQPRKVNKKNHVVEPIRDVDVKYSLLNTNSEPICATCKKSMFDGVHDMFLLDFVKSVVQIVRWYLDSGCSNHMTGNRSQLMNFARIMGYGDYQLGNLTISRVYYVEGLGDNLFSVGVDLLSGSRDTNLYTISLDDMLKTSSICLLSKASKTKSWLWHRQLSHLNFACALGKSKKSSHQLKAEDTNQEKLYLLHMDLYGPMRVASINGKKLMQDKKLDLSFFHVFGALCYPTNDNDDLGKLDAKADIAMASEKFSSGPGLHSLIPATSSSGLVPNLISQQPCIPPKRDD